VPSMYAAIAGIELMEEIGIPETQAHVRELNAILRDGLDDLGAQVVTPREPERSGALVCVRSGDVNGLVAALSNEGIVTSARDENLRISAHCYNTAEDVEAVLAALGRNHGLLC
jgi:selenocysteine lyase/cysteine desulfurase